MQLPSVPNTIHLGTVRAQNIFLNLEWLLCQSLASAVMINTDIRIQRLSEFRKCSCKRRKLLKKVIAETQKTTAELLLKVADLKTRSAEKDCDCRYADMKLRSNISLQVAALQMRKFLLQIAELLPRTPFAK
jgi:hypothetical protein